MKQVTSLNHLKELINSEIYNYSIRLRGGLTSSKFINYSDIEGKDYFILNEIDGSEDNLTESELFDKRYTNIGDALNKGSLYYDD